MDKEKDFSIELNPVVAKGQYSNLAVITHSRNEFILDFVSQLPGMPKPEVVSRLIMSPENAKRLNYALQSNIEKYESQFGPIELDGMPMEAQEEEMEEEEMPGGTAFPFGFGNGAKS